MISLELWWWFYNPMGHLTWFYYANPISMSMSPAFLRLPTSCPLCFFSNPYISTFRFFFFTCLCSFHTCFAEYLPYLIWYIPSRKHFNTNSIHSKECKLHAAEVCSGQTMAIINVMLGHGHMSASNVHELKDAFIWQLLFTVFRKLG